MIRQCPKIKILPRRTYSQGEVIRYVVDLDISYCNFSVAWAETCKQKNRLLFPKDIIINFLNPELANLLSLAIKGDILIANTGDMDEWWITFVDPDENDTNIVFYSPGA